MYSYYNNDSYCYFLCSGLGVRADIQNAIATAANHLCAHHINNRFFSTKDDWPLYQPKHYTTLALIHSRGKSPDAAVISVTQELAVAGNIATSSVHPNYQKHSQVSKNISDIFSPVIATDGSTIDPNMILIEGAPGIGKTVLAKEIAFQWASKKLLPTKRILFLLFLRECNVTKILTIEDFVEYTVNSSEIARCLVWYLLETKGTEIAIVLDGYDEISEEYRRQPFITNIINRKIFSQCCLVITSRPTASSHLHHLVDCRVEIVGFTEEDRLDYIKEALQGNDNRVKAFHIQQYLQSNPTINALCYIPLNMTILLCLAEDGIDGLPKTQTEMYQRFIKMTIQRFIKKTDESSRINISSITELPSPHNKVFKELTQLAFDALQSDKIIFTLSEISASCHNLIITPINWNGLGLLKAVQYFNRQAGNEDVTFHFLHFSIQEYMAALYISTLSDNQQIKLLKQTFWKHRYYNTWIMYVGITGATSFALKHFLSGNKFQLQTRLFSGFNISSQLLNDKVKCLHLFQCFEETNNSNVMVLLGKLLHHQEIDLSNQTLLPSDLNTLAYFLCRSSTKKWRTINLSGCNIGVVGCDILCNRFSDKEGHDIVSVEIVDLSHNQLTFSCLHRLFDVFKSWHASEVIISDDTILNTTTHSTLVTTIEETVTSYVSSALKLLLLGSHLYAKCLKEEEIVNVLSRTKGIKAMYLMSCYLEPNLINTSEWNSVMVEQSLSTVHVIGIRTSESFITAIGSALSHSCEPVNVFIYDPFLVDKVAKRIGTLLSRKNVSGLQIVICSGRIQGVINSCSVSSKLSPLELLNFGICIRNFNHIQISPWLEDAHNCTVDDNFLLHNLVEHVTLKKACNCQLQITTREDNVLFASRALIEDIVSITPANSVFLNDCNLSASEYPNIFFNCTTLCIVNSHIGECIIKVLQTSLMHKSCNLKDLFLHSTVDVGTNDLLKFVTQHCVNISAILVTNGMMIGHNPTAKHVAQALHLEPSITVWKLPNCQFTVDVFYQLISWLLTVPNNWTELDFEGCNITEVECQIIYEYLISDKFDSTVNTLNISSNPFTISTVHKLIKFTLLLKVRNCVINEVDKTFQVAMINGLTRTFNSLINNDIICLFVINTSCFVNQASWYELPTLDEKFTEMYLVNCRITSVELNQVINWLKSTKLLKIFVYKGLLCESFLNTLFKKYINTSLELSVYDTAISNVADTISYLLSNKSIPHNSNMSFVVLTESCFTGFNVTRCQLRLLQQATKQSYTSVEQSIVKLVQELKSTSCTELFVLQFKHLEVVDFLGRGFQLAPTLLSNVVFDHITTLKRFGISNYCITDEAAYCIATILSSCNIQLQEVYFNAIFLQRNSSSVFFQTLKNVSMLAKLSFTNSSATFAQIQVDDIAALLSKNSQLKELDFSKNSLSTIGTQKIANAMKSFTNLEVLRIANNHVNEVAAEIIADILCRNIQIQEVDMSGTGLQSTGCSAICRALQKVSTLTKLLISNNNITDEAAKHIADCLSSNVQIEELDLSNNKFEAAGIVKITYAIGTFTNFKVLKLANCNIKDIAAELTAGILCQNVQLQELDLSGNNLQATGCSVICRALQLKGVSKLLKFMLSNNNISDEAARDIAIVLSHNIQLKDFCINGNCFQVSSVNVFTAALEHTSTLTKLYIGNNHINNEAVDGIADILSHNTQLQELELQIRTLLPTNCTKISSALRYTSTLVKLILINSNITSESAGSIAAVLSHNTQLQELNLDGNFLESVGINTVLRSLKNTSTLVKLSMQNNHCSEDAAPYIAEVVSHNTGLQELNLNGNDLQPAGTIMIAKALQNTSTLVKFNVDGICDEAADDIANILKKNTQLQAVGLSESKLTTVGAEKIKNVIKTFANLKVFRMANSNVNYIALAGIIRDHVQLEEVDLSGSNLKYTGCNLICKSLQQVSNLSKMFLSNNNITDAADELAIVLSKNTQLKELHIDGNCFQVNGLNKIALALKKTSTLQKLYMGNNNISNKAVVDIADILSHNTQLQELELQIRNFTALNSMKISNALQNTSSLLKLALINSKITSESADSIAAVLHHNTQLEELNLDGNSLESTGIIIIVQGLNNTSTLVKLSIQDNLCTEDAAPYIAEVISHNTGLQELNLQGNDLQSKGCIVVAKALQNICTLIKLNLNDNKICDEAVDDITAVLILNTQTRELYFKRNCFSHDNTKKIQDCMTAIADGK